MNASILVGYRVAGVPGALLTVAGTILPPLVIIAVISMFYTAFRDNVFVGMAMNGMLAAVAAVICDVVFEHGPHGSAGPQAALRRTDGRLFSGIGMVSGEYFAAFGGMRCSGCGRCPARTAEGAVGIMVYMQLLWSFFQIGLFSIGGGYAAMPLIQHQVVELHQWLTMNQFADIMTIAEMTPGPIAINSATFVGMQIAGISGAIVATLMCASFLCDRDGFGVVLQPLAGTPGDAGNPERGASSGSGNDCVGRAVVAAFIFLRQSAWPESWGLCQRDFRVSLCGGIAGSSPLESQSDRRDAERRSRRGDLVQCILRRGQPWIIS